MWYALDESTKKNGAMYVVPDSRTPFPQQRGLAFSLTPGRNLVQIRRKRSSRMRRTSTLPS